jgi:polyphosphate kinase
LSHRLSDSQGTAARGSQDALLTNRELSWLDFNRRVLALAEDGSLQLLERVKFLAIASRNLDEFFQVRVALLNVEYDSPVAVVSPDGLSVEQQLDAIRSRTLEFAEIEQRILTKQLLPQLAERGIRLAHWYELGAAEREELARAFHERIFPVLTPLAVDPTHPFPYVSNLSFNLAVMLKDPATGSVRFARIKIPDLLDRFQRLVGTSTFVPIEQIIAAHLQRLFPGREIQSNCPFRVTRDADLDLREDDADDLLIAVESSLERRRRLSDAVRLEVHASMSQTARELLLDELELEPEALFVREDLLDLGALWQLYEQIDRPELKEPVWAPQTPPAFTSSTPDESVDVFSVLREGEVLVQHPYDSFDQSVLLFLEQAAADPDVLAIKHTLYRSSGPENPIGQTLIKAARAGKQVVTLVELKARFDEETNIEWARAPEQAGVHVLYGLVGLKTHAKAILVIRREGDAIRRYCHVGTGNYNPATARQYEDIGLFSARPELGEDLGALFNHLTGFSRPDTYRKLICAPEALRSALLRWIREEIEAGDGRIVLKVNSLADARLIAALYEASSAGVEIDLIVRGICCLRPGVAGVSDRIRVRSVLGRYLEHSRIYRFGNERRGVRHYIGSADLMPRNLDRRVELLGPVEAPEQQERIDEILRVMLADDELAWELNDRRWQRVETVRGVRAQRELQRLARRRSQPG